MGILVIGYRLLIRPKMTLALSLQMEEMLREVHEPYPHIKMVNHFTVRGLGLGQLPIEIGH